VKNRQNNDDCKAPLLQATHHVSHDHIHFIHKHPRLRLPTDMLGSQQTLACASTGNPVEPTNQRDAFYCEPISESMT
jgi:hypothetical protein